MAFILVISPGTFRGPQVNNNHTFLAAKSLVAMVLTMWDKPVLVFHETRYLLASPSRCGRMKSNVDISFVY